MCGNGMQKGKKSKKKIKSILASSGAIAYFSLTGMLLFGANGFAYIDPSVMTYVIQAVSGILIAIGAAVGICWRKAKKNIKKKLDIDENKNKEVESDDIEVYEK